MKYKVAIVTDSNSGITRSQANKHGIAVISMPFSMDGATYYEAVNLSEDEFYEKLSEDTEIFTSQPSTGTLIDLWDALLNTHESIIYIPMSSGLSSSCQTALVLAQDYGGRVQVVDNRRISVPLKQSVLDAKTLADAGWDAVRIKEYLESVASDSSIYIMVDTFKYLKKGGRVTPAGAALGELLNIKPVLQIQGDKLDSYAKALGTAQARSIMIEAMRKDFNTRFAGFSDQGRMWLQMAYTYDREAALDFKRDVEDAFPGYDVVMDPLSLSVACHIGPGAMAIGCAKKLDCLH